MRQNTILVIDDEKIWRNLLIRFLTIFHYTVHTAATCEEGNRMAESHRPDCVLVDGNLTDGKAADVCSFIRSSKDLLNTPIIVLSSDPDEELYAYESKADGFYLKGTSLYKIMACIESLLSPAHRARGKSA